MKTIRTALLILCALPCVAFSQVKGQTSADSLKQEIMRSENSRSDVISKTRRLLLDKFMEADYAKTRELKDFLKKELENQDYEVLYPGEYWLILYWTKEFNELIVSAKYPYESQYSGKLRIRPQEDMLFAKLREASKSSQSDLKREIYASALEDSEKDYLFIFLKAILAEEDQSEQDELNHMADVFLSKYPSSEYEPFIRKYIRHVYKPSKWGYGFEFFSGYGVHTGALGEKFTNNIPIGVAFDIQYRNVILYLRDYIGFSKNKTDIPYNGGVWPKDAQVRVFLPEATLGYVVVDNRRLKIAPFVGISSTDFSPTEHDLDNEPDLKNAELSFTTTYTMGLSMDINLRPSRIPIVSRNEDSSIFIRIRYAYNMPQFEKKYPGMNGNLHYITIGFGGFGRKIKREN